MSANYKYIKNLKPLFFQKDYVKMNKQPNPRKHKTNVSEWLSLNDHPTNNTVAIHESPPDNVLHRKEPSSFILQSNSNLFKNTEIEKTEIQKKADEIVESLLNGRRAEKMNSITPSEVSKEEKEDIKIKTIRDDNKFIDNIGENQGIRRNINNARWCIDPKKYIWDNIIVNPWEKNAFSSYDKQVICWGESHFRDRYWWDMKESYIKKITRNPEREEYPKSGHASIEKMFMFNPFDNACDKEIENHIQRNSNVKGWGQRKKYNEYNYCNWRWKEDKTRPGNFWKYENKSIEQLMKIRCLSLENTAKGIESNFKERVKLKKFLLGD